MKTSVKILLGVVLVIFMIPTVFLMAFNYRAKSKDFKPYNIKADEWSRVDIGPSRFIKVSGVTKDAFECRIIADDKPHYFADPNNSPYRDSVQVSQKGDTLYVNYISLKEEGDTDANKNYFVSKSVDIYVSDWQQLEINGATVKIDSSFGRQYMAKQITISESMLNLGIPIADGDYAGQANLAPADSLRQGLNDLQINANNSQLILNSNYKIGKLQLGLKNTEFTIGKGVIIGSASGVVSQDSHLNIPGGYLSKLSTLIVR